jgi:hypothetical protein
LVISVQVFFLLKEKALINPPQLLSLPYGGEGRGIERERKEGRERRERRVEGGKTEGRKRKERKKEEIACFFRPFGTYACGQQRK